MTVTRNTTTMTTPSSIYAHDYLLHIATRIPLPPSPQLSPSPTPGLPIDDHPLPNLLQIDIDKLMNQPVKTGLNALEKQLAVISGDLTLLNRINVITKDQTLHSLVHIQDSVSQWNYYENLERQLHTRLDNLNSIVERTDRLYERVMNLECVVDKVYVHHKQPQILTSSAQHNHYSRFIPSWLFSGHSSSILSPPSDKIILPQPESGINTKTNHDETS